MSQPPPVTYSPWHQGPPANTRSTPPPPYPPANQNPYQQQGQPPPVRPRKGFPTLAAIAIGLVAGLILGILIGAVGGSRGNKNAGATPAVSGTSTPNAAATTTRA